MSKEIAPVAAAGAYGFGAPDDEAKSRSNGSRSCAGSGGTSNVESNDDSNVDWGGNNANNGNSTGKASTGNISKQERTSKGESHENFKDDTPESKLAKQSKSTNCVPTLPTANTYLKDPYMNDVPTPTRRGDSDDKSGGNTKYTTHYSSGDRSGKYSNYNNGKTHSGGNYSRNSSSRDSRDKSPTESDNKSLTQSGKLSNSNSSVGLECPDVDAFMAAAWEGENDVESVAQPAPRDRSARNGRNGGRANKSHSRHGTNGNAMNTGNSSASFSSGSYPSKYAANPASLNASYNYSNNGDVTPSNGPEALYNLSAMADLSTSAHASRHNSSRAAKKCTTSRTGTLAGSRSGTMGTGTIPRSSDFLSPDLTEKGDLAVLAACLPRPEATLSPDELTALICGRSKSGNSGNSGNTNSAHADRHATSKYPKSHLSGSKKPRSGATTSSQQSQSDRALSSNAPSSARQAAAAARGGNGGNGFGCDVTDVRESNADGPDHNGESKLLSNDRNGGRSNRKRFSSESGRNHESHDTLHRVPEEWQNTGRSAQRKSGRNDKNDKNDRNDRNDRNRDNGDTETGKTRRATSRNVKYDESRDDGGRNNASNSQDDNTDEDTNHNEDIGDMNQNMDDDNDHTTRYNTINNAIDRTPPTPSGPSVNFYGVPHVVPRLPKRANLANLKEEDHVNNKHLKYWLEQQEVHERQIQERRSEQLKREHLLNRSLMTQRGSRQGVHHVQGSSQQVYGAQHDSQGVYGAGHVGGGISGISAIGHSAGPFGSARPSPHRNGGQIFMHGGAAGGQTAQYSGLGGRHERGSPGSPGGRNASLSYGSTHGSTHGLYSPGPQITNGISNNSLCIPNSMLPFAQLGGSQHSQHGSSQKSSIAGSRNNSSAHMASPYGGIDSVNISTPQPPECSATRPRMSEPITSTYGGAQPAQPSPYHKYHNSYNGSADIAPQMSPSASPRGNAPPSALQSSTKLRTDRPGPSGPPGAPVTPSAFCVGGTTYRLPPGGPPNAAEQNIPNGHDANYGHADTYGNGHADSYANGHANIHANDHATHHAMASSIAEGHTYQGRAAVGLINGPRGGVNANNVNNVQVNMSGIIVRDTNSDGMMVGGRKNYEAGNRAGPSAGTSGRTTGNNYTTNRSGRSGDASGNASAPHVSGRSLPASNVSGNAGNFPGRRNERNASANTQNDHENRSRANSGSNTTNRQDPNVNTRKNRGSHPSRGGPNSRETREQRLQKFKQERAQEREAERQKAHENLENAEQNEQNTDPQRGQKGGTRTAQIVDRGDTRGNRHEDEVYCQEVDSEQGSQVDSEEEEDDYFCEEVDDDLMRRVGGGRNGANGVLRTHTPGGGYTVSSTPRSSFQRMLFRKTKLCKYFPIGMCRAGADCNFAHGSDLTKGEMRRAPDLEKTSFCKKLLSLRHCDLGIHCPFAHSAEELKPLIKTLRICLFHWTGRRVCIYGDKCRYVHDIDDAMAVQLNYVIKMNGPTSIVGVPRRSEGLQKPENVLELLQIGLRDTKVDFTLGRGIENRGSANKNDGAATTRSSLRGCDNGTTTFHPALNASMNRMNTINPALINPSRPPPLHQRFQRPPAAAQSMHGNSTNLHHHAYGQANGQANGQPGAAAADFRPNSRRGHGGAQGTSMSASSGLPRNGNMPGEHRSQALSYPLPRPRDHRDLPPNLGPNHHLDPRNHHADRHRDPRNLGGDSRNYNAVNAGAYPNGAHHPVSNPYGPQSLNPHHNSRVSFNPHHNPARHLGKLNQLSLEQMTAIAAANSKKTGQDSEEAGTVGTVNIEAAPPVGKSSNYSNYKSNPSSSSNHVNDSEERERRGVDTGGDRADRRDSNRGRNDRRDRNHSKNDRVTDSRGANNVNQGDEYDGLSLPQSIRTNRDNGNMNERDYGRRDNRRERGYERHERNSLHYREYRSPFRALIRETSADREMNSRRGYKANGQELRPPSDSSYGSSQKSNTDGAESVDDNVDDDANGNVNAVQNDVNNDVNANRAETDVDADRTHASDIGEQRDNDNAEICKAGTKDAKDTKARAAAASGSFASKSSKSASASNYQNNPLLLSCDVEENARGSLTTPDKGKKFSEWWVEKELSERKSRSSDSRSPGANAHGKDVAARKNDKNHDDHDTKDCGGDHAAEKETEKSENQQKNEVPDQWHSLVSTSSSNGKTEGRSNRSNKGQEFSRSNSVVSAVDSALSSRLGSRRQSQETDSSQVNMTYKMKAALKRRKKQKENRYKGDKSRNGSALSSALSSAVSTLSNLTHLSVLSRKESEKESGEEAESGKPEDAEGEDKEKKGSAQKTEKTEKTEKTAESGIRINTLILSNLLFTEEAENETDSRSKPVEPKSLTVTPRKVREVLDSWTASTPSPKQGSKTKNELDEAQQKAQQKDKKAAKNGNDMKENVGDAKKEDTKNTEGDRAAPSKMQVLQKGKSTTSTQSNGSGNGSNILASPPRLCKSGASAHAKTRSNCSSNKSNISIISCPSTKTTSTKSKSKSKEAKWSTDWYGASDWGNEWQVKSVESVESVKSHERRSSKSSQSTTSGDSKKNDKNDTKDIDKKEQGTLGTDSKSAINKKVAGSRSAGTHNASDSTVTNSGGKGAKSGNSGTTSSTANAGKGGGNSTWSQNSAKGGASANTSSNGKGANSNTVNVKGASTNAKGSTVTGNNSGSAITNLFNIAPYTEESAQADLHKFLKDPRKPNVAPPPPPAPCPPKGGNQRGNNFNSKLIPGVTSNLAGAASISLAQGIPEHTPNANGPGKAGKQVWVPKAKDSKVTLEVSEACKHTDGNSPAKRSSKGGTVRKREAEFPETESEQVTVATQQKLLQEQRELNRELKRELQQVRITASQGISRSSASQNHKGSSSLSRSSGEQKSTSNCLSRSSGEQKSTSNSSASHPNSHANSRMHDHYYSNSNGSNGNSNTALLTLPGGAALFGKSPNSGKNSLGGYTPYSLKSGSVTNTSSDRKGGSCSMDSNNMMMNSMNSMSTGMANAANGANPANPYSSYNSNYTRFNKGGGLTPQGSCAGKVGKAGYSSYSMGKGDSTISLKGDYVKGSDYVHAGNVGKGSDAAKGDYAYLGAGKAGGKRSSGTTPAVPELWSLSNAVNLPLTTSSQNSHNANDAPQNISIAPQITVTGAADGGYGDKLFSARNYSSDITPQNPHHHVTHTNSAVQNHPLPNRHQKKLTHQDIEDAHRANPAAQPERPLSKHLSKHKRIGTYPATDARPLSDDARIGILLSKGGQDMMKGVTGVRAQTTRDSRGKSWGTNYSNISGAMTEKQGAQGPQGTEVKGTEAKKPADNASSTGRSSKSMETKVSRNADRNADRTDRTENDRKSTRSSAAGPRNAPLDTSILESIPGFKEKMEEITGGGQSQTCASLDEVLQSVPSTGDVTQDVLALGSLVYAAIHGKRMSAKQDAKDTTSRDGGDRKKDKKSKKSASSSKSNRGGAGSSSSSSSSSKQDKQASGAGGSSGSLKDSRKTSKAAGAYVDQKQKTSKRSSDPCYTDSSRSGRYGEVVDKWSLGRGKYGAEKREKSSSKNGKNSTSTQGYGSKEKYGRGAGSKKPKDCVPFTNSRSDSRYRSNDSRNPRSDEYRSCHARDDSRTDSRDRDDSRQAKRNSRESSRNAEAQRRRDELVRRHESSKYVGTRKNTASKSTTAKNNTASSSRGQNSKSTRAGQNSKSMQYSNSQNSDTHGTSSYIRSSGSSRKDSRNFSSSTYYDRDGSYYNEGDDGVYGTKSDAKFANDRGSYKAGSYNAGSYNAGSYNAGSYNAGSHSTAKEGRHELTNEHYELTPNNCDQKKAHMQGDSTRGMGDSSSGRSHNRSIVSNQSDQLSYASMTSTELRENAAQVLNLVPLTTLLPTGTPSAAAQVMKKVYSEEYLTGAHALQFGTMMGPSTLPAAHVMKNRESKIAGSSGSSMARASAQMACADGETGTTTTTPTYATTIPHGTRNGGRTTNINKDGSTTQKGGSTTHKRASHSSLTADEVEAVNAFPRELRQSVLGDSSSGGQEKWKQGSAAWDSKVTVDAVGGSGSGKMSSATPPEYGSIISNGNATATNKTSNGSNVASTSNSGSKYLHPGNATGAVSAKAPPTRAGVSAATSAHSSANTGASVTASASAAATILTNIGAGGASGVTSYYSTIKSTISPSLDSMDRVSSYDFLHSLVGGAAPAAGVTGVPTHAAGVIGGPSVHSVPHSGNQTGNSIPSPIIAPAMPAAISSISADSKYGSHSELAGNGVPNASGGPAGLPPRPPPPQPSQAPPSLAGLPTTGSASAGVYAGASAQCVAYHAGPGGSIAPSYAYANSHANAYATAHAGPSGSYDYEYPSLAKSTATSTQPPSWSTTHDAAAAAYNELYRSSYPTTTAATYPHTHGGTATATANINPLHGSSSIANTRAFVTAPGPSPAAGNTRTFATGAAHVATVASTCSYYADSSTAPLPPVSDQEIEEIMKAVR